MTCFAYVGSVTHPSTWHLPYLDAQGEIDHSRLPKAIQAVLTNYRGAHVSSIPEEAVPLVLRRLAAAARRQAGCRPSASSRLRYTCSSLRPSSSSLRAAKRIRPFSRGEPVQAHLGGVWAFLCGRTGGRPAPYRSHPPIIAIRPTILY